MKQGRVDIITMGCSKNLVDSERLMRRLAERGYEMCHDSHDVCGEYVVVNTCGFIGDAKEESVNMILELGRAKAEGRIGRLAVMGCLSERYIDELKELIPEVDAWYGKYDWEAIVATLPCLNSAEMPLKPWERTLTGPSYSAYLKISEGCNRFCAYCAIPIITGRHKSRPVAEIVDEVRSLVASGVTEFNVIAQDLSAYGLDLGYSNQPAPGTKSGLATLVEQISDVPGVRWIRLHYAYPVDFPYDVLTVMRERDNVCNYLDIALQHISTPVLENMRRHIDRDDTLRLIDRIRSEVPGIRLRTTLMTGFPGEGDLEFSELLDFVRDMRFERLGAFAYCEEDDTYAHKHFEDSVPVSVKEERKRQVLELQEEISLALNNSLVGQRVTVLIDRIEDGEAVGRTQWDSPEVDNEVRIMAGECDDSLIGQYKDVVITDADAFDLTAEFVD